MVASQHLEAGGPRSDEAAANNAAAVRATVAKESRDSVETSPYQLHRLPAAFPDWQRALAASHQAAQDIASQPDAAITAQANSEAATVLDLVA